MTPEIIKSDDEWRSELTAEQFAVLRQQGTERAFSGKYWDCHDDGMYRCAGCGAQLFESGVKFDSGTGWPSFTDALPGAVETRTDSSQGMVRTEVICTRCGGHLGHVFDDGPAPGGKRFCINSCAIDLDPSAGNPA